MTETRASVKAERLFSGSIGAEYEMLRLICPVAAAISGKVGDIKPGGAFINGDRYTLDDSIAHTRLTQEEARHWFKSFAAIGRYDLLEQWIIHLFSDESPDHIMRLGPSINYLDKPGFGPVEIRFRDGVNTLLTATKPKR